MPRFSERPNKELVLLPTGKYWRTCEPVGISIHYGHDDRCVQGQSECPDLELWADSGFEMNKPFTTTIRVDHQSLISIT
jgi:hypothetical protein